MSVTEETKRQNRELCEKYPFLIPSNRWTGKRITDGAGYWAKEPDAIPEYDYEFTELDSMPSGWRKAFGTQLCDELKAELESANYINEYRITDIKEKYGTLRIYDNCNTAKGHEIISRYEDLSSRICIKCGKPATRVTTGWISPYCDDCCPDEMYSADINDFYKG